MKTKFIDHVHEFRRRVLWVILSFLLSGTAAYVLRVRIINILQKPLHSPLYYTSPAGGFNFVMEAAFIIAVFVTLPVIIYQVIKFIEPALPIKIKKVLVFEIIAASVVLALLGTIFAFYILVPQSLHFFSSYSSAQVKPLINAGEYLDFVANTIITFAIVFQIPLLILFINRIKPLKPKKILHYQKLVIVGSFILAVVLPFTYSPISQFIVVIPIIFLYYLSIILLAIVNRGHNYDQVPKRPAVVIETRSVSVLEEPKPDFRPVSRGISIDGFINKPLLRSGFNNANQTNNADILKPIPRPSVIRRSHKIRSIDGFFSMGT